MPESPEIRTMANHLNNLFINKICKHVIIMEQYKAGYTNGLYSSSQLNYQLGQGYKYVDINGKLTNVTARGKKIIFIFDENHNNQFRFVSGCGLTGHWSLTESKHTCIKLIFEDSIAYYEQVYIGGNFSICSYPSLEYDHIFSSVGPDLFNDETSWPIFYNIMRNPKTLHWLIAEYMLEQKFMSGIGNWIRGDVLYKCAIHPDRSLGSFSDMDLANIWTYTKNTIFEAYNLGGLTIQDYLDVFGSRGRYITVCYGRKIDEFGNHIITKNDKKGRKIHFCPAIQH
jgi:formamidopyrimidine-DNA glycosylase